MAEKKTSEQGRLHHHGDKSETIIAKMPGEAAFIKVAETFQLISDPTRLKILYLLCHAEECVNNIAVAVGMSAPAVSHHLKILKEAGLLSSCRQGKEIYYKLAESEEAALVHRSVDDIFDINCPCRI